MSYSNGAETVLWTSRPANVVAARTYGIRFAYLLIAALLALHYQYRYPLAWLVVTVPGVMLLWTFLRVRTIGYELTSERLRRWEGVFSRRLVEIELYRARETSLYIPFMERLAGVGNVQMNYADAYGSGTLILAAVPDPESVRELLRQAIESVRQRKGIRTVEAGL